MMRLPRPHRTGRLLTAVWGIAFATCAAAQTNAPADGSERLREFRAELERLEASVQALRRAFEAFAQAEQAASSADELPDASPPDGFLEEPDFAAQPKAAASAAAQMLAHEEPAPPEEEDAPAAGETARFVVLDPPLSMLREGRQAFKDREFYAAEKKFREFLGRYPRHAEALSVRHWLGEVLYEQGAYQEAIEAFGEVLEHGSGSRRLVARLKTGYAWFELGEFEKARTVLAQVREEDPNGSVGRLAQLRLERLERKAGAE